MFGGHNPFDKIKSRIKGDDSDDDDDSKHSDKVSEKEPLVPDSTPSPTASPKASPKASQEKSRTSRVWNVRMPPAKKHMVGGHLVPTVGGTFGSLMQKTRRITVEIHAPEAPELIATDSKATAESVKTSFPGLVRGDSFKHDDNEALEEGDKVMVRVWKPDDDDSDDDSSEEGDLLAVPTVGVFGADEDPGDWKPSHIYDLDYVEILKSKRNTHDIQFGHGSETKVRSVNFESNEEAESFVQVLHYLRKLESKRTEQRVQDFKKRSALEAPKVKDRSLGSTTGGESIRLLVEIVSGIDLPVADVSSTDPYVIVRLGSEEVHRTKPIMSSVNPIWSVDTGSLFLLDVSPEVFFASSSGLTFILKDYDSMSQNETIGKVKVPQDDLLKAKGERTEFKLEDSLSKDKKRPGKLVLRFREATKADIGFMARLASAKKSDVMGVYGNEAFVPPHAVEGSVLKRESRKVDGETQFRVKPGPDPAREEQATKWLTEKEIDLESEKPSTKWVETGSGEIGKLFVEVLSCSGLPNLDTRVMGGGKTDAFACLVYEDCVVNTEVINDTLSPRWMPWSQRAFIFHIMHPSSQLMVGLFDYDAELAGQSHDPIARATVDITNFHANTEYTLYYDLYTSALVTKRKAKGQIKLRLKLQLDDARKAILAGMYPPPQVYLNVPTLRDYQVVMFTCEGKYNIHLFSMDVLTGYVGELQEYQSIVPVVREAVMTVLFWHGHFPLKLRVLRCPPYPAGDGIGLWDRCTRQTTILLPLHSMTAFIGGIFLAENYNLFPSFSLFAIAWFFLAMYGHQCRHPSPWQNSHRSVRQFLVAILGAGPATQTIEPFQNEAAVKKYIAEKEAAELKRKEEAEQAAAEASPEEIEAEAAALNAEADVKMSRADEAPAFSVAINPLKPILLPLQQVLQMVCEYVRITRSVVTWEESFYAFWIVLACIVGGLVFLFVPWGFLLRWTIRIAVWVLLGPWMKLVEMFVVKKVRSSEEEKREADERIKAKYKALLATATHRQTQREDMLKLRQMKRYMFGEYSVCLPRFKQARHIDRPLLASHASPIVKDTSVKYEISCRKYGQHLAGDMIPKREIDLSDEGSPLIDTDVQSYGATDDNISQKAAAPSKKSPFDLKRLGRPDKLFKK